MFVIFHKESTISRKAWRQLHWKKSYNSFRYRDHVDQCQDSRERHRSPIFQRYCSILSLVGGPWRILVGILNLSLSFSLACRHICHASSIIAVLASTREEIILVIWVGFARGRSLVSHSCHSSTMVSPNLIALFLVNGLSRRSVWPGWTYWWRGRRCVSVDIYKAVTEKKEKRSIHSWSEYFQGE